MNRKAAVTISYHEGNREKSKTISLKNQKFSNVSEFKKVAFGSKTNLGTIQIKNKDGVFVDISEKDLETLDDNTELRVIPSQKFDLTVSAISAHNLKEPITSFLEVRYEQGKKIKMYTQSIKKNHNPVWNEKFYMGPITPDSNLKIYLWEKDTVGKTFTGKVVIPLELCKDLGYFEQTYPFVGRKKR